MVLASIKPPNGQYSRILRRMVINHVFHGVQFRCIVCWRKLKHFNALNYFRLYRITSFADLNLFCPEIANKNTALYPPIDQIGLFIIPTHLILRIKKKENKEICINLLQNMNECGNALYYLKDLLHYPVFLISVLIST